MTFPLPKHGINTADLAQKYVKEKAIFISFGILDDYVVLNGRLDRVLNMIVKKKTTENRELREMFLND